MTCARESCSRSRRMAFLSRRRSVWFEDAWYCSAACFEEETRVRLEAAVEPMATPGRIQKASRLGSLLVHQRTVSPATLQEALKLQRDSGLRLGAQLIEMGAAPRIEVLRALAAQSGVGYVASLDPATIHHGPGHLSRDAVRALGVVPVDADADRRHLKVACAAPLPRLAMAVLRELTGARVDPLIVEDGLLIDLLDAYGAQADGHLAPVTRTRSVEEAAQRIAAAVWDRRAQRMQHVRCEPYLWVRLEGEQTPEEIVVPIDAVIREASLRKERAWRADPTSL